MSFGLTNAPAVFQHLVNDVLRDFLNSFVFVYLDDHFLYSRTNHLHLVLDGLLENPLSVKGEKCEFHVSTVSFLGFIIEAGNIPWTLLRSLKFPVGNLPIPGRHSNSS